MNCPHNSMAGDQSFQELAAFLDAALAPDADVDAADVQRRLQNATPDFLNLLQQKVLRPRSRAALTEHLPCMVADRSDTTNGDL